MNICFIEYLGLRYFFGSSMQQSYKVCIDGNCQSKIYDMTLRVNKENLKIAFTSVRQS